MAANADLILAGISGGGGGGTALAWFAPTGTAAPTSATSSLNAAFKDAGWISEDGLTKSVQEDVTDVPAFGTLVPVRKIVTKSEFSFKITMLEHNAVSLNVYNRLPLTGGSAIVIDPDDGTADWTEGTHRVQKYAAVFDLIDGANHKRCYCPSVEVTGRDDEQIKAAAVDSLGVTLTAYPGSDGVAAHWFILLDALIVP
jgi:hypothetical protein